MLSILSDYVVKCHFKLIIPKCRDYFTACRIIGRKKPCFSNLYVVYFIFEQRQVKFVWFSKRKLLHLNVGTKTSFTYCGSYRYVLNCSIFTASAQTMSNGIFLKLHSSTCELQIRGLEIRETYNSFKNVVFPRFSFGSQGIVDWLIYIQHIFKLTSFKLKLDDYSK